MAIDESRNVGLSVRRSLSARILRRYIRGKQSLLERSAVPTDISSNSLPLVLAYASSSTDRTKALALLLAEG